MEFGSMGLAWAAANVALSAVLYLFDFATNILTLRAYYFLGHTCVGSYVPDCRDAEYGAYGVTFEVSLALILLAHACNSIIFWRNLDPSQHPLRLAYFLPLIHLSRLLRLLFCTSSSLKDLRDTINREASSLYNVLSAALESTPQLILQFYIASSFVLSIDELHTRFDYSRVPKKLILSLVASVTSITYNGGVSCMSNVPEVTSLWRKTLIGVTAGVHTLAVVAAKCLIVAAFFGKNKFILPAYFLIGVTANWAHYSGESLKSKSSNSMTGRSSGWMMSHMHTLAVAYVSFLLGPLYVVSKHFPGPDRAHRPLVFSTLLHILLDLIGLALLLLVSAFVETRFPAFLWESPCPRPGYSFYDSHGPYMPCSLLPRVVFSSLLLILLTTLLFAKLEKGAKPVNYHIEMMSSRSTHEKLAPMNTLR